MPGMVALWHGVKPNTSHFYWSRMGRHGAVLLSTNINQFDLRVI